MDTPSPRSRFVRTRAERRAFLRELLTVRSFAVAMATSGTAALGAALVDEWVGFVIVLLGGNLLFGNIEERAEERIRREQE